MDVSVRYFAVLREQRGTDEERLEVEPGTTAQALYETLFPAGAAGRMPVAFAVNQAYVPGGTVLSAGDEVAFIPPLGGG